MEIRVQVSYVYGRSSTGANFRWKNFIYNCRYHVKSRVQFPTESCFRHPLFDLRGTRKVEIRHTNFHFSSKKVTSKSRKVVVFDSTIVKNLSTFRPKKAKVEKLKSRKVEKLKS